MAMNNFMIKKLIQKDWHLCKPGLFGCLILGIAGLVMYLLGSFRVTFLGIVALDIAVIMMMYALVFAVVIFERKDQTLAFLMSLPVSNLEYTLAKSLIGLGCYFIAWLLLYIGAVGVLQIRIDIGNTIIPYFTILYCAALMFYCLGFTIAMVTESEPLTNIVLALGNVTIQISITMGMTFEALAESVRSPTILWNGPVLTILAIEGTVIVLSIAALFHFQLRKKDFL